MEELMVRIDNQLKLSQNAQAPSGELKDIPLGTLVYSPARLELQSGNRSIKLSNR